MKITKIHIKNFRSFSDSGEQTIKKLFALIGKNNSGKSAFIDAIRCLWGHRKITAEDSHKRNNEPITIKMVIESADETGEKIEETEVITEFRDNKLSYSANGKASKTAPSILPKLLVIPAIRNPESEASAGKDSFLKDLISVIVDLKTTNDVDFEALKSKKATDLSVDEIKYLLDQAAGKLLEDVGAKATDYLQESLEDSNLGIAVDTESELSKAMKYATKITDRQLGEALKKINLLNCGTGLQSMAIMALLQTYAELQNKEDSILLIEEPEVYLHPDFQRKMFAVLRRVAKRTQVIYTTHSPIMISELWDNSVRLITRHDGETTISEIDINSVVKELGIRYEDVLNPKVVIFVEGINDIHFYERVIKLTRPEIAENLEKEVKFVETGGFDTIHLYALMNILLSVNVNVPFYVVADSDGESREDRVKSICGDLEKRIKKYDFIVDKGKVEKLPETIYPLTKYAIESYFLTPSILQKLVPDLKEEAVKYFIQHYEQCYKQIAAKGNKNDLKQKMKPKRLFEDPNTASQLYQLKKGYGDDERFLAIRERLVKAWEGVALSGKSPIELMLDEETIKEENLKEPIQILEKILEVAKREVATSA